ncbi:MAG: parallel beta-helix domain-containing protein, partial [Phenylobacterium sp.]
AGGILVFDLPGLPQMGGHSTRVFRNKVVNNDTPNFAPKGNIVAGVPTGTGVMVMANRDVHVFDNEIDGNQSSAVMLVAYRFKFEDKTYNPLPRDIVVRNNRFGRNGWDPTFDGGKALAAALGGGLPPVLWDGVVAYPGSTTVVRVRLMDGPVANLNLPEAGATDRARPTVTPTLGDAVLPEPAPVALPKAQAALAP